jgi:GST-like protein
MIELYTWTTPNGFKPLIMLEELGTPFRAISINIGSGAQHAAEYLRINPNGKIPALIDPEASVQVFESGAILIYLAEKAGKFLPSSGQPRAEVLEWLMFQMSAVGPMFGQLGHFRGAKREDTYALERFTNEVSRIAKVLEGRLADREHLAGDYSIADIATVPWANALPNYYKIDMAPYPNVTKWLERINARPAVKRALAWKPQQ